ncbi:MAG: bifunctional SulP family inorganic anion transporter/carbonic anhydrase [Planctomycetaceae bacterium]|nr:bifunctional SulP family inorganic anion transporter/carbonic anhydrase [Planctomycetaceae bacterium]
MTTTSLNSITTPESQIRIPAFVRDLCSGVVLFLIAAPIGVGIATTLGLPPQSGLVAAIIGGLVVGVLSGSKCSVAGPSAGLSLILVNELQVLASIERFWLALLLAGGIQFLFGRFGLGKLSYFMPSSVVRGLIAAVGLILILKQIPHMLGHDVDPMGEMSFWQQDLQNTFSELLKIPSDFFMSATLISAVCLLILLGTDLLQRRFPWASLMPGTLLALAVGTILSLVLKQLDPTWGLEARHFLQLAPWESGNRWAGVFVLPNVQDLLNPLVYVAAMLIAVVASLETLLALDAVDRMDPEQRSSSPNRELMAQGVGNLLCGIFGGLPLTSRLQFSQLNLMSGGKTQMATILHGSLLLASFAMIPLYLNVIPLACIATVLFYVGTKLLTPYLIRDVWNEGRYQFLPFLATALAIVFTEKLIGAAIGLSVSLLFILTSSLRRPLRRVLEKHLTGELLHIQLPNQTSFLYRAGLEQALREAKPGTHILLNAQDADYIDPDVLRLVKDFKEKTAPKQGVEVSLRGFRDRYELRDETKFIDYSTRELQEKLTPSDVLKMLQEGNARFKAGESNFRDYAAQLTTTGAGQFPFAAVLSCIDSRAPVETILDLGLGDIFSVRIAGNVVGPKVLGSLEYACGVAGSKLILVLGHTKCGAVTAAVKFNASGADPEQATGCRHLNAIVDRVNPAIDHGQCLAAGEGDSFSRYVESVTKENVIQAVRQIVEQSPILGRLAGEGKIGVVGAVYDVAAGEVEFFVDSAIGLPKP